MGHRLIEEEFDELLLYVAGLKKSFSRKLDDHLFIIQQQNDRLDEQARIIDEIAWQLRDLRSSVRAVDEKLEKRNQNLDYVEKCKNCDYANVIVGGRNAGNSNGAVVNDDSVQGGAGEASTAKTSNTVSVLRLTPPPPIRQPRITIINEDDDENVDADDHPIKTSSEGEQTQNRESLGSSSWDEHGLYEPIEFFQDIRRDYMAPSKLLGTSPTSSTSLSARHRQMKEQRQGSEPQKVFHFPPPPPPPLDYPEDRDSLPEVVPLRPPPSKDYQALRRMITTGSSLASVDERSEEAVTTVTGAEEQQERTVDYLRGRRSPAEREANSIKRRAYILPRTGL